VSAFVCVYIQNNLNKVVPFDALPAVTVDRITGLLLFL